MNIELITTGSELLLGFVVNTHLNFLARALGPLGLRINRHTTVGDDPAGLRAAIADALSRADILFVTGGLGPTSDDVTREVTAALLGRPLHFDPEVAGAIRERFRRRGVEMPEKNLVQAMVPEGARVLPNRNGTAPGLAIEHGGKQIFLLPGPPRELEPMFAEFVLPMLPRAGARACRVYKVALLPESVVEEKVGSKLADMADIELGYCARAGEVEVRLMSSSPAVLVEADRRIREALGAGIFATGEERLEEVVIRLLAKARRTVVTAESCTGGFVAHRLTNVSGASAVFLQGWVVYSNAAKQRELGVREETLAKHGAVSEAVAREMAEGARRRAGADYAVSATGIAGPTGGTPTKPVGLVFVALAAPARTVVQRWQLSYDRETFKFFVSQAALDMLRRELLADAH
ncbi:MAG: competence/damage-inducible protein A [Verrucomicrobiae bacterium]|nr:competence/damage-inducible protein A [Verrucomicrobiae bacterium]